MFAQPFLLSIALTITGVSLPSVSGQAVARFIQEPAPQNPSPADKPDSTQQPTAPAAPATKPTVPPKHVYTNDDMRGGGDSGGLDFSQINDCDRACFDQVRQLAHVVATPGSNWKRDLLQAIDQVRKDTDWQAHVRELYNMHLKFCALGDEKRAELNRVADPHNVTAREISVDEKYDAKFKQLQISLQSLTSRQAELLQKFAVNPFSLQFARIQASRVSNASCGGPVASPSYGDDDP
jgi:hypothetical protein